MAVDGAIHRLFIPCRKPARMLVINSDTGSITAWKPTVGDADDVFVDEAHRMVYVIGGDGYVDAVFIRAGDALVPGAGAHGPRRANRPLRSGVEQTAGSGAPPGDQGCPPVGLFGRTIAVPYSGFPLAAAVIPTGTICP